MTSQGTPPPGDSREPSPLPAEKRRQPRTHVNSVPGKAEVLGLHGEQAPIPGDFVSPKAREGPQGQEAKHGLSLEAILFQVPGQPSVTIKLRNTSRRGMGFFCRRGFAVGDRFAVRFHFADADDRLILCQVRHSTEMKAGWHEVGVEFVEAIRPKGETLAIPRNWILRSGT